MTIDLTAKTDFYIDSYPLPGGTGFVEQFIQGRPCIGLTTRFFGYTPLEIIKKDTVVEVIDLIKNPPSTELIKELQTKIFEVHGYSNVQKRFITTLNDDECFQNPMQDYIKIKPIINSYDISFSKRTIKQIYYLDKALYYKMKFVRTKPIKALSKLYKKNK